MGLGVKDAHVDADLGQNLGRARALDSRDAADQIPGLPKGGRQGGLDALLDDLHLALQKVDVVHRELDHLQVMGSDSALERRRHLGRLLAQLALEERQDLLRVKLLAAAEGLDQSSPRDAKDVRHRSRQLHVGVLQGLMNPVLLRRQGLQEAAPAPGQIPQVSLLDRRHVAPLNQAAPQELGQPLGVPLIGLPARDILDLAGVRQQQLELLALEDVPDRPPEDAGGLHRHHRDCLLLQPIGQFQKSSHGGTEGPQLTSRSAFQSSLQHASHHRLLVHVQSRAALDYGIHRPSLQPSNPSRR